MLHSKFDIRLWMTTFRYHTWAAIELSSSVSFTAC